MSEAALEASLDEAAALIQRSHRIAIFSHVNPDGDSIGVSLGLGRGLNSIGHDTCVALSDPVPPMFHFLPDVDTVVRDLPAASFDLLLVADCGDIARVGRLYEENRGSFSTTPILNLDHHDSNTLFGTVNYVDITAASSSELAYYLFQRLDIDIDRDMATDLLAGIVNDTGSFQHSNTDSRVLRVAAELRARGGDLEQVAFAMFRSKPLSTARLWGAILSTIELDAQRGIVWARMASGMAASVGATTEESEGIVDYLSGIQEAKVAAFLKEKEPGQVRVSMRSRGIDVARICAAFGGGGHIRAAGCTINSSLSEARLAITREYDELCASASSDG